MLSTKHTTCITRLPRASITRTSRPKRGDVPQILSPAESPNTSLTSSGCLSAIRRATAISSDVGSAIATCHCFSSLPACAMPSRWRWRGSNRACRASPSARPYCCPPAHSCLSEVGATSCLQRARDVAPLPGTRYCELDEHRASPADRALAGNGCRPLHQRETLVPVHCDFVTPLPVSGNPFRIQIGQEGAGLAGDVRAHVPGIGARHQRHAGDLIHMSHPPLLRLGGRLDDCVASLAHMVDAIGYPFHMLLDRHRHVRQHRRALRAGDREKVRETSDGNPEIAVRAVGPRLIQLAAAAAL